MTLVASSLDDLSDTTGTFCLSLVVAQINFSRLADYHDLSARVVQYVSSEGY